MKHVDVRRDEHTGISPLIKNKVKPKNSCVGNFAVLKAFGILLVTLVF